MRRKFSLFFHLWRNLLDYPLRQFFRWQRKGLHIKNEAKDALFTCLPEPDHTQAQATAGRLLKEYHLEALYSSSTMDNYCENLYYLEMLESALTILKPSLPDRIAAADIGSTHWFYVQALYAALKWWQYPAGREVALSGYERDAYRVYANFHSRYDHALAHINNLPGVEYKPYAFMIQSSAFDIITHFFPFIFLPDHLEWGLLPWQFNPSELLNTAWLSLKPGGLLIIANQGKEEHQTQLELLNRAGITVNASFPFSSPFYHYDIPRFVCVACREHDHHLPG
ncbi:MAG: hypothetical protein JW908_07130 [Anaerolineales bacterium]|nr:hypothetical protein [Anaerolineales bacterium]